MSIPLQEVVCCLGQPVAGNPTQYMMEKAFEAAGLDWRYLTCEVPPERLEDAMRGIRALGFKGANFTIPHKVAVLEYLDELSEAAELMGAVNCVNRVGEKLIGENTDGKGFVQSLREVCNPAGKRIAIIGAGGAARAIAVELGLSGAGQIVIVNRSQERGEQLVELLRERVKLAADYSRLEGDYAVPEMADILINATSIGLGDPAAQIPVAASSLRPELIVADVIFNPPETWLIRTAKERGCRAIDGLGMLVNQAVISFKIWTGQTPDAGVMRDALEEFLEL
ncbi:MAG TPA: shikimate dehydrogenase [Pirellulaceae bacterium]|nr:shikimate dehydrogenase [Pirellulaceae bacterium]